MSEDQDQFMISCSNPLPNEGERRKRPDARDGACGAYRSSSGRRKQALMCTPYVSPPGPVPEFSVTREEGTRAHRLQLTVHASLCSVGVSRLKIRDHPPSRCRSRLNGGVPRLEEVARHGSTTLCRNRKQTNRLRGCRRIVRARNRKYTRGRDTRRDLRRNGGFAQ